MRTSRIKTTPSCGCSDNITEPKFATSVDKVTPSFWKKYRANAEERKKEFTYYCEMCDFGSFCEEQLNKHNETIKHKYNLTLIK